MGTGLPPELRCGIVAPFMILSRCLVLAACLGMVAGTAAQLPPPASAATPAVAVFPGDERASKLAERYRAMLVTNPTEGIALDRLWKAWDEQNATAALIAGCQQEAERLDNAASWLVCGYVLKKAGRFDEAAAAFSRARRVDPAGLLPMVAEGELALARNQPAAAAPAFDEAASKLPPGDRRRADLLMKAGNAWITSGQPEKAAESWEKIIASSPANLALHKQLGEIYVRHHLTDKALVHYEYIDQHADPPERAAALQQAGRLHENRGEFEASREAYERGLTLTAHDNWLNGELQAALVRLYERAGRTQELEARWRRAAEEAPRDLNGLFRLLTLAEAQGDPDAQKKWLEKITTLAPRDRTSRLKLARLLADTGERDAAAAAYDQLLKDQPDQLELLLSRADLDLQQGQPALAISRLEVRIARNPSEETLIAPVLEFFLAHHLDEAAECMLRGAVGRQPAALEPSVALARFFFSRRQMEAGRRVLADLTKRSGKKKVQTERWQRLASVYRDENLPEDALQALGEWEKLAPQDPAPRLAVGEIYLARGDARAAAEHLENAADLAKNGVECEEIERKLFQVLFAGSDGAATPGTAEPTVTARRRSARAFANPFASVAGRPETAGFARSGPLTRYLERLVEIAERKPDVANTLRLARWQAWSLAPKAATVAAEKVLSLDPANVPARILLANLAAEGRQHEVAIHWLKELTNLDPDRKPVYLRQIAALQLEDGDFDTALAEYGELQEQRPGALEPLMELALAQQRADHWFDALASWRQAYGLPALTPTQRAEVRHPLIAAFEHLGEFKQAAELLRDAVDEQPELIRKQEFFHELNELCGKHDLVEWLTEQYENRLQNQPDDYFTLTAVADLRRTRGREDEAYELMKRAFYSAPDPIAALKSLADEAEALGEEEQAVAHRRKLVGMAGQGTVDNLEKLAALEESEVDDDTAARTWEQVTARFPRDTVALGHAAEFYERTGQPERTRRLLMQAVDIDPADLQRLSHLADLDREVGDVAGAHEKFERVLASSSPEKIGDPLSLPAELEPVDDPATLMGGMSVFSRPRPTFSVPAPVHSEDHAIRLHAIHELALLLPDKKSPPIGGTMTRDDRKAWVDRWMAAASTGARSEPLQALYGAGEGAAVMDLLAGWLAQQPADDSLRGTFLLAGLRLGAFEKLAQWVWPTDLSAEYAARGALLVRALQQFLSSSGKPPDDMVAVLFPPRVKARDLLWKVAKECFAERHWYGQAAELGERTLKLFSAGRGYYAVETAQWELYRGRADLAREVLGEAIAEGSGSSFDGTSGSAIFQALRGYYLLLPTGERKDFVDNYLRQWRERGEPVHGILSAILLHGLQGDEDTAKKELDILLSMRMVGQGAGGSPDVARWNYVLANGTQLQTWNFGSLAVHFWRMALREETAFDRQNGGLQSTLTEIRGRLVYLEIITSTDPQSARERLVAYLCGHPPMAAVSSGATQFMATSHFAAARQFYEYLTAMEPDDGDHWRNLLSACGSEGDTDAAESILATLLDGKRPLPPTLNRAELVRQWATLLKSGGDPAAAIRLLERELQKDRSVPIVTTLAFEYERTEKYDEAARVWREGMTSDPTNAKNYRLALARLEEKRGDLSATVALLEPDVIAKPMDRADEGLLRLATLYLKTGRQDAARQLALDALKGKSTDALIGIARIFAREGQKSVARGWLATLQKRTRDPETRFQVQLERLQANYALPAQPLAEFLRDLRRMRNIANASPALKTAYDSASYELALKRGADAWLEGELGRAWRNGQGDFPAGERLVSFYLERHQMESLRQVMQSIDRRPNLPEQSLRTLQNRLGEAGFPELALPVSERLHLRFPDNEFYALAQAQVLWRSGRTDEAKQVLENLDRTCASKVDLSNRIASLCHELGDLDGEQKYACRAVERDPAAVRSQPAFLQLARIEMQRRNWIEAKRLLLAVYRHPVASTALDPIVDFLFAMGGVAKQQADQATPSLVVDFPLTSARRLELHALIYERLKSSKLDAQAATFVAAHPEFLAGTSFSAETMRREATLAQMPVMTRAFEAIVVSGVLSNPRLKRELCALYVRWSDQLLNLGDQATDERLRHLTRANELAPDDFEAATRLAALYWEQGQPATAAHVLQPFLAADAVPTERQLAHRLLAMH